MSENSYDTANWPKEEQARSFMLVAEQFYRQNFGRMGKADLEVLLFSIYIEHLLNNGLPYDDYTLALQLGIPESRVRNLKVKKELQYPYSGYDWKRAFAERIPYAKYDEKKALVKVSIPDPNVRRDVEHYIDSQNWYSEYQLNSKLLQMRPDQFIDMCVALYSELSDSSGMLPEDKKAIGRRLRESASNNWFDKESEPFLERIAKEGIKGCLQDLLNTGAKAGFKVLLASIPFGSAFQPFFDAFINSL